MTLVYEFFDPRVLGHLWFVALSDGATVQLLAPTFRSERAARIFERAVLEHPSGLLLSIDGQLELARRIESQFEQVKVTIEPGLEALLSGLPVEGHQPGLTAR